MDIVTDMEAEKIFSSVLNYPNSISIDAPEFSNFQDPIHDGFEASQ